MRECLVTKKVVDHAFMNDRCQNFLNNRMSYSVVNKDIKTNEDTEDDRVDPPAPPAPQNQSEPRIQNDEVGTPPHCRASQFESNNHDGIEDEGGEQSCSICLETFQVGDSVSWSRNLTHCSHAFHTDCLNTWLERKADCPCCRGPFFTKDDLDLKVQGCRELIGVCFGCKKEKKKNGLIEIGFDTDKNILFDYRNGADFCVEHGLIFPPGYVILTKSDEEINGFLRARARRRFSSSSSADYLDFEAQELDYIYHEALEEIGGIGNESGDTNMAVNEVSSSSRISVAEQ